MELAPEEFVGSNSNNNNDESQSHLIVKGKRTKRRHRSPSSPSPPTLLAATSSSSSATAGGDEYLSLSSPTTSSGGGGCGGGGEIYESTEEEEDMANCLILLAQGDHAFKQIEKLSPTITTTTTTTAANTSVSGVGKAGFFVYECKTCNRTFPSFQALGGHRASHKKPRAAMVEDKKASPPISTNIMDIEYEDVLVFNKVNSTSNITTAPPTSHNNSMPLQQIANVKAFIQSNKAAKIHECSVCGSEFTSGQALGGHMRRHRAASSAQSLEIVTNTSTSTSTTRTSNNSSMDEMKQRNILALDLNLPAPEDDHHRESNKFQFVPTQQALVFSSPALVDCHY
ncbi:zinc finger protein ZAT5 [Ziziphus jujuba]|uniref:Zinc finger protein ZAT5 n=2 Tax=Ziziphus jujuba TaxID=326968 RepID=A0A6P3Z753_ZIZJJ|nr:zinc finger protein ZAT5 [Ziziphus jujuba]KAH7542114.1 hypothetical protein FEM48_Zijuj02G0039100 [Ziziphus jujuba var. spinosa]